MKSYNIKIARVEIRPNLKPEEANLPDSPSLLFTLQQAKNIVFLDRSLLSTPFHGGGNIP